MTPSRPVSVLGSLVLLLGYSEQAQGQRDCPWGPVSISSAVESEWIRTHGMSEEDYLQLKCNALMPREEREKLCRALGECERNSGVAERIAGVDRPRQKSLDRSSVLYHEAKIFAGFDFSAADRDHDSRLSPEEALAHLPSACLGLFAEFELSDTDRNGLLDREEASALRHTACPTGARSVQPDDSLRAAAAKSRRRDLFRRADTNTDHCVRLEEAATLLRPAASLVDLTVKFKSADAGLAGCLRQAEWSSLLTAPVRAAGSH